MIFPKELQMGFKTITVHLLRLTVPISILQNIESQIDTQRERSQELKVSKTSKTKEQKG